MTETKRTSVKEKAKQLIKLLKPENPDYNYLREVFRQIRKELNVQVNTRTPKKLPLVPTEEEIEKYYEAVWKSRNMQHVVMIKTLLYTGVRVTELVHIKLSDIDFDRCQIRVNQGTSVSLPRYKFWDIQVPRIHSPTRQVCLRRPWPSCVRSLVSPLRD